MADLKMELDFDQLTRLGTLLARDYARDFFRLLGSYCDISASEASSLLQIHIKTAQEFLEGLTRLGLLSRTEIREGKRPYFRYALIRPRVTFHLDFSDLSNNEKSAPIGAAEKIRERKSSTIRYNMARNQSYIGSIVIWTGAGRIKNERRINLTVAQGKFLAHLPFPTADFMKITEILKEAEVGEPHLGEILDLVQILKHYQVIDTLTNK